MSEYYRARYQARPRRPSAGRLCRPSPYYCSRCQQTKTRDDFYYHKTGRDAGRRQSYCKVCSTAAAYAWQRNHPEVVYARRKRRSLARKLAGKGTGD